MIFLYFLPLCLSCCLGSSPGYSCILSFRQFTEKKIPGYSNGRPKPAVHLSQFAADKESCSVEQLVSDSASVPISKNLRIYFLPSQLPMLLAMVSPCRPDYRSFRFYPPHCYQVSQAGTSTLLRIHLPPPTASDHLEFPLDFTYPTKWEQCKASPVKANAL